MTQCISDVLTIVKAVRQISAPCGESPSNIGWSKGLYWRHPLVTHIVLQYPFSRLSSGIQQVRGGLPAEQLISGLPPVALRRTSTRYIPGGGRKWRTVGEKSSPDKSILDDSAPSVYKGFVFDRAGLCPESAGSLREMHSMRNCSKRGDSGFCLWPLRWPVPHGPSRRCSGRTRTPRISTTSGCIRFL
jgi:hypothetical protein